MSLESGFAVIGVLASIYCLFRLVLSLDFVVKHLQIMNAHSSHLQSSHQKTEDDMEDCTPIGKAKFPK